jgi:hypothetical protein
LKQYPPHTTDKIFLKHQSLFHTLDRTFLFTPDM